MGATDPTVVLYLLTHVSLGLLMQVTPAFSLIAITTSQQQVSARKQKKNIASRMRGARYPRDAGAT